MANSKKTDTPTNGDEDGSKIPQDAETTALETEEKAETATSDTAGDGGAPEDTAASRNPDDVKSEDETVQDAAQSETEVEAEADRDPEDTSKEAEAAADTDTDVIDEEVRPEGSLEAPEDASHELESAAQDEEKSPDDPSELTEPETDIQTSDTTESPEPWAAKQDADGDADAEKPAEAEPEAVESKAEADAELETAERKPEPEPKIVRETQIVKGSIWPGFFGGLIAAMVGFIAGRGDVLDSYLPASMQRPTVDISVIDAVAEQTNALAEQSAAQSARIEVLESASDSAPADVVTSEAVAALSDQIAAIADRIGILEERPVASADAGASEEALAALESIAGLETMLAAQETVLAEQEAMLAEQESMMAEQTQRLEELANAAQAAEASAESEAARILARAALARVEVAVDSGEPFEPALTALEEVTSVEVPEPLRAASEAGVPTMVELQASFSDAARDGLAAARAEVPESEVVGISGFIRRQLNVRSVVPREGSDPDAVLSRAEAAVRAGDLATALTEMDALPDSARAAMNDWLEAASARKAAQDAAKELSESLGSN